ncbi:response regulator transcription factor [Sphingobacterium suaedae]|uniref:Response regulator transcription factor n=1 Tax=Sphingobacterium suaedae TaxID=1686402 RepID=A0ABW5KFZ6_9SPHI
MYNVTKSVALVDDHQLVLKGLISLLEKMEKYEVIGSFSSGISFLEFMHHNSVDIVLLDVSLPDISGIDICKELKKMRSETTVLALSNHSERSLILQMLNSGASGYLLKNVDAQELERCLNRVDGHDVILSEDVQKIVNNSTYTDFSLIPQLTKREQEILKLIADGLTTNQIADLLFLSPLTVETHRKRMMSKFQTKNMASLLKIAFEYQII